MNWRFVHASEVGTSHVATGRPCEDSSWSQVDTTASGIRVLSIFVADGAGSASHGGDGAEFAIQAAAAFVSAQLHDLAVTLDGDMAGACIAAIRQRIFAVADEESLSPRDFACTFLGVISSSLGTLVMQLGDGGIVIDVGQGLEVPIIPMSGEYANMTHFVTDDDAVNLLVLKVFPSPVRRVAVFSDGLQRLALDMATNTAYEPFFAKFFAVLSSITEDKEAELQAALVRFLSSSSVNERTDDDKTLALAVLVA